MKPTEMEEKFHEFAVPRLALAIKDHGYDPRFTFKEGREWHRIHHQTGGLACNHVKMWCTFLTVKEDLLPLLDEINDKWLDSNIGVFGVRLDEVLTYRAFINKNLGADCDKSYADFEDAIYPLDCSVQLIRALCEDVLPDDLDELLHFENDFSRTLGFANRWKLYILGENCD
jgi:hypothetical protein